MATATTTEVCTNGVKRKLSVAGLPGSARPVKRRASKACHCCRSRKVRCDVVESGIPCTNCRLDEVECVVTEGKRRKKSCVEGDARYESPVQSVEEREEVQKFPLFDDIDALHDLRVPSHTVVQNTTCANSGNSHMNNHKPHLIYQMQGQRMSPDERNQRISLFGNVPGLSITPIQLPPHLQYHPPTPPRPEVILPNFITPIPRRMLSEDLEYLRQKGAFHLPETPVRNELLRSYVQYVHPFLPLIDLKDFLTTIDQNGPSSTISLLLYHAVMFAASAYIDMRYLASQGFSSRKSARKAYFQRVKLLYDFDWEMDRITVVQSVLLMTYWYESPSDPKDVWYWLGIAISIARTIGLNYSTESASILSPQQRRLWKRVWWSVYVRDRVIAIGMRRPIRIHHQDFDVPMLELDDFETAALPPGLCRMLGGCSAVRDEDKRTTLAKMCIALVEVCKLITGVLAIQYSTLGHKIGATSETTIRLVPKAVSADTSEVLRCDHELNQWYESLPLELRYFKQGSRERTNIHDGEVIFVHRALLTSIYHTASSALHRPQMMPAMPNLIVDPDLKVLSQGRVHDAATDVTAIYRDLYAHDLIKYLPNTGVTVLLPAIIIHLMDIKSPDNLDKHTSSRNFQFCMQALQKLRDLYSSADFAFSFLDAAIKSSDLAAEESAELLANDSGSLSKKGSISYRSGMQELALTPPPDSFDEGIRYVDQSTLSGFERERLDALTPPLNDRMQLGLGTNGMAISLRDLERFVGLDDSCDLQFEMPGSNDVRFDHLLNATTPTNKRPGHVPVNGAPLSMNEFDNLLNLESGPDLFAPNQVSIDDNLFKDIDMEWLADSNESEDEVSAPSVNDLATISDAAEYCQERFDVKNQLATPPSSTATPPIEPCPTAVKKVNTLDLNTEHTRETLNTKEETVVKTLDVGE